MNPRRRAVLDAHRLQVAQNIIESARKHYPKAAAVELGTAIAHRLFASRGDHTEVHLSEAELAALLVGAADIALMRAESLAELAEIRAGA